MCVVMSCPPREMLQSDEQRMYRFLVKYRGVLIHQREGSSIINEFLINWFWGVRHYQLKWTPGIKVGGGGPFFFSNSML